ncbi:hypothetical protein Tco_1239141 [Tanacetum coccineum]
MSIVVRWIRFGSHGLPARQSVIVTPCASFVSTNSANFLSLMCYLSDPRVVPFWELINGSLLVMAFFDIKRICVFTHINDAAKEKDNDDHTNHTLVETHAIGSMETRNEQMQTPIPTPTRSSRKDLSFDKTISEELMETVSPTINITSKTKSKRGFTSNKTKILPGIITGMSRRRGQIHNHIKNKFVTHDFFMGKIQEVLDHCNNVVPELTFAKTNEIIKEEMPRLVHLVVKKDQEITPTNVPELISKEFATHAPKMIEELFQKHMQNTTLNLYPTTSSSTAKISTADLQHQLYLKMKSALKNKQLIQNYRKF